MNIQNFSSVILLNLVVWAAMAAVAGPAAGIAQPNSIPFIGQNRFENVIVHADSSQPEFCPKNLTNHVSNTNLFTLPEQAKIAAIRAKYHDVSTNSFPPGAVLKGWEKRMFVFSGPNEKWQRTIQTNVFYIASLSYPASRATEELTSFQLGLIHSRFRDEAGSGYDVVFTKNQLFRYIEYSNGEMDGLYVTFNSDFSGKGNHLGSDDVFRWTRFSRGKIVGKLLDWDLKGRLITHVEFTKPFDFLAHSKDKFDLSWEIVPSSPSNTEPAAKK